MLTVVNSLAFASLALWSVFSVATIVKDARARNWRNVLFGVWFLATMVYAAWVVAP